MARRSSVIRSSHEMALPSCQLVGASPATQAVALARGLSHAPCTPSGARWANHLREQMLHMPYDEPGRIGVGWPRSEFADEPNGVLHRCRFARADPRAALGSGLARAAYAWLCRRGPER